MSHVLAVCQPASDAGFSERVQHVVAQDRWDMDSPEGIALMQGVLRETYPMATVVGHDGVWAGGTRRTIVLNVWRDGLSVPRDPAVMWAEEVYDRSGGAAYRLAARILGEGAAAEAVVERAFREVIRSRFDGITIEAAGAALEASAHGYALAAHPRLQEPPSSGTSDTPPDPPLAGTTLRRGCVRKTLSGHALSFLLSWQREALELAVLEDLKVAAIAERMRTTASVVHGHLRDALLAVGSGVPPSAGTTLARWREAQRSWARLQPKHPARPERALAVAHAWLDYEVATGAIGPGTVVLVTDADRRFVAASANAGQTFDRPSVIGLHIDDVTASYGKALVPDLWTVFDANGSMHGDYDCDRPGQAPIRIPFHGVWGRPLPDLQVGYLQGPGVPTDRVVAPSG